MGDTAHVDGQRIPDLVRCRGVHKTKSLQKTTVSNLPARPDSANFQLVSRQALNTVFAGFHAVWFENTSHRQPEGFFTALSPKHGDVKESRLQPTTQPSRHPHTHTHTHTRTPTRGQSKPTQKREAQQKAEEQVPPGRGHQWKSLDIQSPSAVTIAVPAPTTGSHPKKVPEEAGGFHSKSKASENSDTSSSSTEEEL